MIQQAIDQNATANQFAVSDTPFHTHNGADSQRFSFKNLSDVPNSYYQKAGFAVTVNSTETGLEFDKVNSGYAGYVNSDGTAGHLPSGWSSSTTGTGQYTVTHNLGTANYSAIAMSYASNSICKFNSVGTTNVQFVFLDSKTQSLNNTEFYFILIPF